MGRVCQAGPRHSPTHRQAGLAWPDVACHAWVGILVQRPNPAMHVVRHSTAQAQLARLAPLGPCRHSKAQHNTTHRHDQARLDTLTVRIFKILAFLAVGEL